MITQRTLIDPAVIAELRSYDQPNTVSVIDQLVKLYLNDLPNMIKTLSEAKLTCDYETIAKQAHIIISASGNLGAVRMAQIATDLQAAAKDKKPELVSRLLDEVDLTYPETRQQLLEIVRTDH